MPHLIDENGNIYEKGALSGAWHRQEGILGPKKDVDWLGRPNIRQNILGQREHAQGFLGTPTYSDDNRPLYQPSSSSGFSSGGGDVVGEGIALILGLGLIVLTVLAVGAIFAIMIKILSALFEGWHELNNRYPRAMLTLYLLAIMIIVGFSLYIVGFNPEVVVSGVLLVPGIWGWLWLTRNLPIVFMPINSLLAGGGLWILSRLTDAEWHTKWSQLTTDLPVVTNLPLLLAALPISIWLWSLGAKKWPEAFRILNRLVTGAILWFILFRVWTEWQPHWEEFTAPVPLLSSIIPYIILSLPLVIWLWFKGQSKYPIPFTAMNLLIFGGLLGLTAYHTEQSWISAWNHWMAGLPFITLPILSISLTPVSFWGWSRLSHNWRTIFVIPNLLLTGAILWWVLDRTRPLWKEPWELIWGGIPLALDPAAFLLIFPLAVWLWRKGSQRWPQYGGAARALLLGGISWVTLERTRELWCLTWSSFTDDSNINLAILFACMPIAIWTWSRLHKRWPRAVGIPTLIIGTFGLWLLIGWVAPNSTFVLQGTIALLPLTIGGWLWLLRCHTIIGVLLTFFLFLCISAVVWFFRQQLIEILKPAFSLFLPVDMNIQGP